MTYKVILLPIYIVLCINILNVSSDTYVVMGRHGSKIKLRDLFNVEKHGSPWLDHLYQNLNVSFFNNNVDSEGSKYTLDHVRQWTTKWIDDEGELCQHDMHANAGLQHWNPMDTKTNKCYYLSLMHNYFKSHFDLDHNTKSFFYKYMKFFTLEWVPNDTRPTYVSIVYVHKRISNLDVMLNITKDNQTIFSTNLEKFDGIITRKINEVAFEINKTHTMTLEMKVKNGYFDIPINRRHDNWFGLLWIIQCADIDVYSLHNYNKVLDTLK